ncbi:MAG: hypothetical protein AB7O60_11885 [Variibacter sp.]
MDVGALASAFVGAKTAQVQLAVAAKMMRMNADSQAAVAQLLESAQQNGAQLAAAANGLGANLDISV